MLTENKPLYLGGAFYLHAPEILPSLHDEVKGIAGAIGLGHHETEFRRFVQKRYFTKIAVWGFACPRCRAAFWAEVSSGAGMRPGEARLGLPMVCEGCP